MIHRHFYGGGFTNVSYWKDCEDKLGHRRLWAHWTPPIMSLFSLDSLCWPGSVEFLAILSFLSSTWSAGFLLMSSLVTRLPRGEVESLRPFMGSFSHWPFTVQPEVTLRDGYKTHGWYFSAPALQERWLWQQELEMCAKGMCVGVSCCAAPCLCGSFVTVERWNDRKMGLWNHEKGWGNPRTGWALPGRLQCVAPNAISLKDKSL